MRCRGTERPPKGRLKKVLDLQHVLSAHSMANGAAIGACCIGSPYCVEEAMLQSRPKGMRVVTLNGIQPYNTMEGITCLPAMHLYVFLQSMLIMFKVVSVLVHLTLPRSLLRWIKDEQDEWFHQGRQPMLP
jgi:hypothetical protein